MLPGPLKVQHMRYQHDFCSRLPPQPPASWEHPPAGTHRTCTPASILPNQIEHDEAATWRRGGQLVVRVDAGGDAHATSAGAIRRLQVHRRVPHMDAHRDAACKGETFSIQSRVNEACTRLHSWVLGALRQKPPAYGRCTTMNF